MDILAKIKKRIPLKFSKAQFSKENNNVIFTLLTLVLTFSGWGAILYQNIQNKPKIKGEILAEITSEFSFYLKKGAKEEFIEGVYYSPYIFLTNVRNNTVYIKDIILIYKNNRKVDSIYLDYTIKDRYSAFQGLDSIKGNTSFQKIIENTILSTKLEVSYGTPLKGFVSFPMETKAGLNMHNVDYDIVILDIFNRSYRIHHKKGVLYKNLNWFEHFSGITIQNFQ